MTSDKPIYKAVINCMVDGCNWKLSHDNKKDGVPNWTEYAKILRDHNTLKHENFEVVDNIDEITEFKHGK